MWWCLDQTATATRTSRPIHRGALAHPTLASLGFLSLRLTRQIYTPPPRDRDRNTGGPFWLWIFACSARGRRHDDERPCSLLFSLSSAHDTPSSSPPIGLPLHARLFFFFNQPFSVQRSNAEAAEGAPRERESIATFWDARAHTHASLLRGTHTHAKTWFLAYNIMLAQLGHQSSSIARLTARPSVNIFPQCVDLWQASFSPHDGVGYKVPGFGGPGMTA